MYVAQITASEAHEVVMAVLGVGVVAGRPATRVHLLHLAHGHQLVQRVVHGCQADFWETLPGSLEDFFCGEVDVITIHRLGDDPSLRREAPRPRAKAVEKRCRRHAGMYTRRASPSLEQL